VYVVLRQSIAGVPSHRPTLEIYSQTAGKNSFGAYVKLNPEEYLEALKEHSYLTFDGKTERRAVSIRYVST